MKLTKDDLIAALRLRYDYYSAQTMLEGALTRAELPQKDAYDASEIAAFRAALTRIGDRLATVDARLDSLVGAPAPAANAEKPAEPKAAAANAKPVEPAPAEPVAKPTAKPTTPELVAKPTANSTSPEPVASTGALETIETVITLTGVPVGKGERVLVCGGLPELGDWDVTRAQPMVREGDRWLAKLALAAGTEAAFKFVRCTPDGKATWEAGDNRSLVAVPSIETSWQ